MMKSQVKMAVDMKLNRRDFLKLAVKVFAVSSAVLGLGELCGIYVTSK